MMQLGRTMILLAPDALFSGVKFVVKRHRVLKLRSGVRCRTPAATGKFP